MCSKRVALLLGSGLSVLLACGTGDGDVSTGNGANKNALGDDVVTSGCADARTKAACKALAGCVWSDAVLESYPPQIMGCIPADGGGSDDCSVVSSDGTVTYVPCDGNDNPGTSPANPGGGGGDNPTPAADDEADSTHDGGVVSTCNAATKAACEALAGCVWSDAVLESYPPQIMGCIPADGGGIDDCSVVSSDGTITYVPCDGNDGAGSSPSDSGSSDGSPGGAG